MKWIFRGLLALAGLVIVLVTGFVAIHWQNDIPLDALTDQWAQPPSEFIDVNGQYTHIRDEGPQNDPVPLVLLHGTSASLHTWDGWTAALNGQHRVIRFDLPGFGLTGPRKDNNYSKEAYVNFVMSVLDAKGVDRFVLAGNSLGGNIAWTTAADFPERVQALILVDSAGYPFQATSVPLAFRISQTPVLNQIMKNVLPRSIVKSSVENVYGDPARVTPELVDRYYDLAAREGNRAALRARFEQLHPADDIDRIRTIQQPTLVLWGAKDQLIPPRNAELFARDLPNNEVVIFDDLGHVPHEEDAVLTVAAVQAFLHKHESQVFRNNELHTVRF